MNIEIAEPQQSFAISADLSDAADALVAVILQDLTNLLETSRG